MQTAFFLVLFDLGCNNTRVYCYLPGRLLSRGDENNVESSVVA